MKSLPKTNLIGALSLAVIFMPFAARALALDQVLGFFNIVVGLFLTASVISFGAGLILYWTRYGTWMREQAFPFMSFGVTILFVLSVLLAIIHFVVRNTSTALYVLSVVALLSLGGLFAFLLKGSGKKEDSDRRR